LCNHKVPVSSDIRRNRFTRFLFLLLWLFLVESSVLYPYDIRPRAHWELKAELTAELISELISAEKQTHCLYESAHTESLAERISFKFSSALLDRLSMFDFFSS